MERFGKYERLREIGSGGFGTVFEGRDTHLDRPVALKFLDSNDADDVERFRREARLAAQLSHPGIVAVHDVFEAEGRHILVMDLLDGVPAGRAGLSPRDAAALVRDVAAALAHAHARGVIHRDLKPDNILVCGGRPVVTDFGLARGLREASTLSMTGAVQGTPSFMSPEQARGDKHAIGPATDVYGLGATLYALVGGRPPFTGRNAFELIRRVIEDDPPPLACDEALRTIVATCMEKEPRRRYPTAEVVADELGRYVRGEPILARPTSAGERARRWILRHRAVASLSAALALAALGSGVAGAAGLRAAERGRVALADATQRRVEETARGLKQERALLALTEAERGWADPELDIAAWRASLEAQLTGLDGDDPRTHFYRGWALRLLGRRDEAIASLDRAIELPRARYERLRLRLDEYVRTVYSSDPAEAAELRARRERVGEELEALKGRVQDPDAALLVEACGHLVASRNQELVDLCMGRIAKGGRFEAFRLLVGIACLGTKEYPQAVEQLNEAVYLHPNLREARFARAQAWMGLGRYDDAIPDLDRLIALDPADPLLFQQRGVCHRHAGRHDRAIADFDRALAIDPAFVPAYTGRSAARFVHGEFERAAEDARAALEIQPRSEPAANNLAAALVKLGRFQEAADTLDPVVDRGTENADLYVNRGTARFALGRHEAALEDLATAARLAPDNPSVHYNQGVYLKTLRRLDEARAALDRAIGLDPDHFEALVHRAMIHAEQGRPVAAKADVERTLALPAPSAGALNNRALARELVGDVAGAVEDLSECIRREPRSREAYYNRAQMHIRMRRFDAAEEDLSAAISIDARFQAALLDRAASRLELRDWTGARDDATAAIQLDPDEPSAYVNRGVARANLRDTRGGAEDLRTALDLAPADWPARATTEGALRDVERLLKQEEF